VCQWGCASGGCRGSRSVVVVRGSSSGGRRPGVGSATPPPLPGYGSAASTLRFALRRIELGRTLLRRILVSTPFTTAERLIPDNAVESVRRVLFPMTQDEVRRVLAGLIAAQVPFVLAGGWGVDALATGQGGRKGGREGGRRRGAGSGDAGGGAATWTWM